MVIESFLFTKSARDVLWFLGHLKARAVAGTLFSAFQEQALVDRIGSSNAKVLVTSKNCYLGSKGKNLQP